MLKILATLPEAKHFRQIGNRGDRYQWSDLASDNLRILANDPNPWGKEWSILIRLEQGKTRAGIYYPKRLNLVCFPLDGEAKRARIIRERWSGNFVHSCEPTLLFFAFPARNETGSSWLMFSVVEDN